MSTKISQLTSATDITASDLMQIVDVEDGVMAPSGTNKKVTASLLAKELAKQPLEPGIVISGSSSGDAVRITQTGSGNALVVEDSANPDSTPFVVAGNGNVGIGTATPDGKLEVKGTGDNVVTLSGDSFVGLSFNSYRDSGGDHGMLIYNAARGTESSPEAVQSGDITASIVSRPYDGSTNVGTAAIRFFVDGAVSSGVIPQQIRFILGSDRVTIKSDGNVGIGTITPNSKLHVAGDLTMSSATVATSATAGTNGDVPAQVAGYLVVNINGTARKIPYYA